MNSRSDPQEIRQDFELLADYLLGNPATTVAPSYRGNLAAFLLHAQHVAAYDLVQPYLQDKQVLEIGCFIGYGSFKLADKAREVISIDIDETALAFALRHRVRENLTFVKSGADGLKFPDARFDVAVAFQVIEHIPIADVPSFLGEVRRVLKPGGIFLATTPNRKIRLLPLQRPWNAEHFQEFSQTGLLRTLSAFFRDVTVRGVRATEWIEEIEKIRTRQCPWNVYIKTPLLNLGWKLTPRFIKDRRIARAARRSAIVRKDSPATPTLAGQLRDFRMSDFHLVDGAKDIDESLSLLAVCKRND